MHAESRGHMPNFERRVRASLDCSSACFLTVIRGDNDRRALALILTGLLGSSSLLMKLPFGMKKKMVGVHYCTIWRL